MFYLVKVDENDLVYFYDRGIKSVSSAARPLFTPEGTGYEELAELIKSNISDMTIFVTPQSVNPDPNS